MTFSQDELQAMITYERFKAKEPEVVTLPFKVYRPFIMGNPYPVKKIEEVA